MKKQIAHGGYPANVTQVENPFASIAASDTDIDQASEGTCTRPIATWNWIFVNLGGLALLLAIAFILLYSLRRAEPSPVIHREDILTFEDKARAGLLALVKRLDDSNEDRELLRQDVLIFRHRYRGSPQGDKASELLMDLPSPLDQLDPAQISSYELEAAERGDPKQAPPASVAILSNTRLLHGDNVSSVAFAPSGKVLASSSSDGSVSCHRVRLV